MSSVRVNKVKQLIKESVNEILQKDIKDPRIQFVTIIDVEVTADLQSAKVYVSIVGDKEVKRKAITALENAASFVRGRLAKIVKLKYIPKLTFELDTSLEKQDRILKLLDEIKK